MGDFGVRGCLGGGFRWGLSFGSVWRGKSADVCAYLDKREELEADAEGALLGVYVFVVCGWSVWVLEKDAGTDCCTCGRTA